MSRTPQRGGRRHTYKHHVPAQPRPRPMTTAELLLRLPAALRRVQEWQLEFLRVLRTEADRRIAARQAE